MGPDFATGQKLFQLDYYIGKRNGTKMRMIIQNHIFDSASLKTLLSRLGKVSLNKWKKCEEKAKLTLRMLDVEAPESLIQEAKDALDADETSTSLMINTCCTVSDPKKPSAYLLALIVLQSGVTEGENRHEIQDILSLSPEYSANSSVEESECEKDVEIDEEMKYSSSKNSNF